MTRGSGVALGAVLLAALVAAFAFVSRGTAPARILDPGDRELVARGAGLYATYCAACHGADLEGQPDWKRRRIDGRLPAPPHDASGHTHHHADALLMEMTRLGPAALAGGSYESDMPAYGGILGDEDIRAVLSYIKSRWPVEVQRRHDELNERARRG